MVKFYCGTFGAMVAKTWSYRAKIWSYGSLRYGSLKLW